VKYFEQLALISVMLQQS